MIANNILDCIGNTPMVRINHLNPNPKLEMLIKLEKFNSGGSVKDRITKYMIESAEKSGQLKKGMTVIEPTSGNTGIGLALVCRVKGYDLALVMPDTMTRERRQILLALGAKVILSEGKKGMDGAEDLAHEIAKQDQKNTLCQTSSQIKPMFSPTTKPQLKKYGETQKAKSHISWRV